VGSLSRLGHYSLVVGGSTPARSRASRRRAFCNYRTVRLSAPGRPGNPAGLPARGKAPQIVWHASDPSAVPAGVRCNAWHSAGGRMGTARNATLMSLGENAPCRMLHRSVSGLALWKEHLAAMLSPGGASSSPPALVPALTSTDQGRAAGPPRAELAMKAMPRQAYTIQRGLTERSTFSLGSYRFLTGWTYRKRGPSRCRNQTLAATRPWRVEPPLTAPG
jgi:hypothetical protein